MICAPPPPPIKPPQKSEKSASYRLNLGLLCRSLTPLQLEPEGW